MDYALILAQYQRQHLAANYSRQRMLYEALRTAILSQQLLAATRLPATRQLSAELGIARNSVIYAYEQLASEGLVCADQRGTLVAPLSLSLPTSKAEIPQQGLSQRGRAFKTPFIDPDTLAAFTPGVPSLADFPHARWQRLIARSWRNIKPEQLAYGHAAGEPALREAIAGHLRAARGAVCDASQVFITDGTQNSLDLCARLFADAGDLAWIENPGYTGATNAFSTAQLLLRGIAVDQNGINPSPKDWQNHPPRLIYVTPSHQYPLGSVLSLERRLMLIRQAQAVGALIIEDDYDSEFRRDGPPLPAMQGLVPNSPVIYLGTFSKTLFPALRTGFMLVPLQFTQAVEAALAQCHPRGRQIEQIALAEFVRSGEFASHLRRMRKLYSERRDAMSEAITRHFGPLAPIYGGSSGMHLSIKLQPQYPDQIISQQAFSERLIARPLSAYIISPALPCNGYILGYAQVPSAEMDANIAHLARLVKTY